MSLPQTFQDDEYSGAADDAGRAGAATAAGRGGELAGRAAFAGATFFGAFLLFLVQPLAAKYLLPTFGGGPAVWTTCVLFFQVALLAGYGYAHWSVRRLSPRAQAGVHLALLAAAVAAVAASAAATASRPPVTRGGASELAPVGQILGLLSLVLLLPSLALSATSPLLNAWYARAAPATGVRAYRLYAVSNAGSLLALLAYPFVIEPAASRRAQALAWWAGLTAFSALSGYCAWRATRAGGAGGADAPDTTEPHAETRTTRYRTRAMWLALPACASVMLLATTNSLTHDVAAMPLLWVLPLVLYLLTFILAFDASRWYRRGVMALALPLAAAGVCAVLLGADGRVPITPRVSLLAGAMFVCCMACHGELATLKPPLRDLTSYYLTIAAGGALGGVLVAVAAPVVLDRYAELHFGLWACCALVLVAPWATRDGASARPSGGLAMLGVAGLVVLGAVLWKTRDPYPFAGGRVVGRWRDFYGVVTLYEAHRDDPHRASVLLRHAGVTHGLQFTSATKRRRPTTYFGPSSGIGAALGDTAGGRARRVGVVGLGAGTLAVYGRSGDVFRFYELSPAVERIARRYFTYLADSPAACDVVLGDGRRSLQVEPPQGFDVLALDAFSGHAVPYHLLTAEAFTLYRRHLAPGGVIAVNVSNRFVDLRPVLARHAERLRWGAVVISNPDGTPDDALLANDWVLLTADPDKLSHFRRLGGVPLRVDPALKTWTDDYAPLYPVLR